MGAVARSTCDIVNPCLSGRMMACRLAGDTPVSDWQFPGKRVFFFEKKNQKTFAL
jgi:hypothetical protein